MSCRRGQQLITEYNLEDFCKTKSLSGIVFNGMDQPQLLVHVRKLRIQNVHCPKSSFARALAKSTEWMILFASNGYLQWEHLKNPNLPENYSLQRQLSNRFHLKFSKVHPPTYMPRVDAVHVCKGPSELGIKGQSPFSYLIRLMEETYGFHRSILESLSWTENLRGVTLTWVCVVDKA